MRATSAQEDQTLLILQMAAGVISVQWATSVLVAPRSTSPATGALTRPNRALVIILYSIYGLVIAIDVNDMKCCRHMFVMSLWFHMS